VLFCGAHRDSTLPALYRALFGSYTGLFWQFQRSFGDSSEERTAIQRDQRLLAVLAVGSNHTAHLLVKIDELLVKMDGSPLALVNLQHIHSLIAFKPKELPIEIYEI